jgi:molybdenum cofactor cytidylyltransferase
MKSDRIGIVVLAAGGSTRMGRPKQLLQLGGKTLIRRATETALAVSDVVAVVTGASAEQIAKELQDLPIQIIHNPDWSRGMGSSLRVGAEALITSNPELGALIVTLCDQVNVTPKALDRLRAAHREAGKGLCAASFDNTVGPPALFARQYFTELLHLDDAAGAKSVLLHHPEDLSHVPCPEAAQDVDTWEEFQRVTGQMG